MDPSAIWTYTLGLWVYFLGKKRCKSLTIWLKPKGTIEWIWFMFHLFKWGFLWTLFDTSAVDWTNWHFDIRFRDGREVAEESHESSWSYGKYQWSTPNCVTSRCGFDDTSRFSDDLSTGTSINRELSTYLAQECSYVGNTTYARWFLQFLGWKGM